MSKSFRRAFVPFLAALSVTGLFVSSSSAQESQTVNAPPAALVSFKVAMTPGQEQLSVKWRYASGSNPASELDIDLLQVAANGLQTKVASVGVDRTVAQNTYQIEVPPGKWAVRATPRNAMGWGRNVTSPNINVTNPCGQATLCVDIATEKNGTPLRLTGSGFLHSLVDGSEEAQSADVTSLHPQQWRFSWKTADVAARTLKVSREQILSDLWSNATSPGNNGYAVTPWSNWQTWQTFVSNTVKDAKRDGWSPNYWDVWNEPNGLCCPHFSPSDLSTVSVDNWLKTYEIAWKAIKSADSNAKIVGPSLSSLQWTPGGAHEFDLDTFLNYSKKHGLRWDAISWHENNLAPLPGDIWPLITSVDRHIATAKTVMGRYPGTVANNTIFINEYTASSNHLLAGWMVGYFNSLENDGVSQANRSCWTAFECDSGLDGLLTADQQPTAAWWAYERYSEMISGVQMSVDSNALWQINGLATRDDKAKSVKILLGRHWSCNRAVNAWCTSTANIPSATLHTTIDWPYGDKPVAITTSLLPAGIAAVSAPAVLSAVTVVPHRGKLTLDLASVNDGDAISIDATQK